MLPTFLAQFAAGCFLAVGCSTIRIDGWKYLRLMAVVSSALALASGVFVLREVNWHSDAHLRPAAVLLGLGIAAAVAWLFINAAQQETVRESQRAAMLLAGLFCMLAAMVLCLRPDEMLAPPPGRAPPSEVCPVTQPHLALAFAGATLLGSLMLGGVTAAMLLGHRYLTDTDMPIAALRRLAVFYSTVLTVRILWAGAFSIPLWSEQYVIRGEWLWFWLAVIVRSAVGLGVPAVFGWMAWDCVRRRATQSATAMYYLSMVFVFLGELAAQFLLRTEGLPL